MEDHNRNCVWCTDINCSMGLNDDLCNASIETVSTIKEKCPKYYLERYFTGYIIGRRAGVNLMCEYGNHSRCNENINIIEQYKLHHHSCTSQSFCPGGVKCYKSNSLKIKK